MTPEHALTFHRCAARDVLAKIKRTYGLTDEALKLSPETEVVLDIATMDIVNGYRWQQRRDECIGNSASPERKEAVDEMAREMMKQYIRATYVRQRSYDVRSERLGNETDLQGEQHFYQHGENHRDLMRIYLNHVTNEIQAQLTMAFDGDHAAAFKMQTRLIGEAMKLGRRITKASYIEPHTSKALPLDQNLAILDHYWRECHAELTTRHRQTHAERLALQKEKAAEPAASSSMHL